MRETMSMSLASPFLPLSKETLETIDYYSEELRVEVDRLLNLTYYPIAVASALFFLFIYNIVSPKISHSLFPRYGVWRGRDADVSVIAELPCR